MKRLIVFIIMASAGTALAGHFTDWQPTIAMTHIPGTNLWHHATAFPSDARLDTLTADTPQLSGSISLYLARHYPGHFDRVVAMSPAVTPAQHHGIEALDPASLKLYVNWGVYDIQSLIPGCESFVEMLANKGFEHLVEVKPQGHSWGFWRDSLIPAFRYIYAP